MTVQEEVRQRIERDVLLANLRKKIDSGKADFNDTFLYSDRAGKMLGEIFAQRLPDIPIAEREALCVELLRDRYTDINALCDAVQRALDEANGLHLKPQRAPFEEARAHLIGHSTADQTVSVETQQRRGRSATATMTRSMHDDRMKAEAKFRSGAGLQCYITRKTDGKCCAWCSAMAGRYEYYSEPKDVYRRHDNCGCSVTYENGRQRQDVWSKRTWEAPEPGAGAGEPVVFTAEQAAAAGADKLHKMTRGMVESERSKIKTDYPSTLVNQSMLVSHQYRAQFDDIEENSQIARIVFQSSRNALLHRTGTVFEDLYFIDSTSGRFLRRIDYNVPKEVKPSQRMLKMVRNSDPYTIIAVHNHPSSGMPSMGDIHLAWERKYKYGVIACHNGNIVQYTVTGEFDHDFVDILLDKIEILVYNKKNEDDNEKLKREIAQTLALLKENNVEMKVIQWK